MACSTNLQQTAKTPFDWSKEDKDVIMEHVSYHKEMLKMLERVLLKGPVEKLHKPPKRKLMDVFNEKLGKKTDDTMSPGGLHLYLQNHIVDMTKSISREKFKFKNPTDVTNAIEQLQEAHKHLKRQNAQSVYMAIVFGNFLNNLFNRFSEQKQNGDFTQSWDSWLQNEILSKKAVITEMLGIEEYARFWKQECDSQSTMSGIESYPSEMTLALKGNLDLSGMAELEMKMVAAFQEPNRLRRSRESTLKASFTYILLDPRITRDLPNRALSMGDLDVFREFISAIFYIGKGKRARSYCHLYEAIKQMKNPKDEVSKKMQHILDIWGSGLGVVFLHCFQSVIPEEAYTREAFMIDAMGLEHLTNMKRGSYYGISKDFSMEHRRTMGVYLLTKSLQIFLAEGERQISRCDIKK